MLPDIDLNTIIVILASMGVLSVIVGVGLPILEKQEVEARLKNIRAKRDELRRQQKESQEGSSLRERFKQRSPVARLVEALHLRQFAEMGSLKTSLVQAGWRDKSIPPVFIFSHIIASALIASLAFTLLFRMDMLDMESNRKWMLVLGGGGFGLLLPTIILKNAIDKRQQKLRKQFPDALDLLLICVQAGLSLEAAFSRVVQEMGDKAAEIGEELGLTAAELAFLGDRRIAFENMYKRTGIDGFRSLATTLIQAERYGTSVAMSLRILGDDSRRERQLRIEKKAGSLPTKLTVPMIAFFMPALLAVILGPAIIQAQEAGQNTQAIE